MQLKKRFIADLPIIMGIMNITPDSFSDGGQLNSLSAIQDRAYALKEAGADLLDIGAESTRPGAQEVSVTEELDRLLPVLDALQEVALPLSIDTYKAEVMRAVLAFPLVELINDINALRDENALEVLADHHAFVCLMHMKGVPRTMQVAPTYQNVVQEVYDFLAQRVLACEAAGIARDRLILDPGFGFGKDLTQNCTLFQKLEQFHQLDLPLLVGVSRKTMLGAIVDQPVEKRLLASVIAALISVQKGAKIIRVHDVAETKQALTLWQRLA